MNKRVIGFIILLFLAISIPLGVHFSQQRQELRSKAALATVLSISPSPVTVTKGDTFDLNIQINTGENRVVGADLALTFNNSILEALDVAPGDFLDDPQELKETIINSEGKVFYSIGSFTAKQPGLGILAIVSFKAKSEGTSSLDFDAAGTSVAAIGETEGIKNTESGSITVVKSSPTSTPISTPTATPTASPTPIPSPTPINTPTATLTPASTPTSIPTSTPTPIPTLTSTPTPTTVPTATSTPVPGKANLTFIIKFQGVGQDGTPNRTAKATLKQNDQVVATNDNIDVTNLNDGTGRYQGTMTDIEPGIYDILIKGGIHLTRKFAGIQINTGENTANWSETSLLIGDFDNNNILNIIDFAFILQQYTDLSVPITEENQRFDVNLDNQINIIDIALVLQNYTDLEVRGDN